MNSVLTKNQKKTFGPKQITLHGETARIEAVVRYDDECGNGHNSFSITATIWRKGDRKDNPSMGGCCHEEVARAFPELRPFIKWHLTSSTEPMHYIANSLYWAGRTKWEKVNLTHFRTTAVWPAATEADMENPDLESVLAARLPQLRADFRAAVESLGFVY